MVKFCINCGSSDLSYEIPEGDNFKRFVCRNCHKIHYKNPRIIVSSLPVYDGKVILCRRAIDPCKGTWNLPGGFMENGERAEDGALRELEEESGLTGTVERLHCTYSIPHVNQVYLIFLVSIKEYKPDPGDESLEVASFHEEDIPWGDIGFTSSVYAIEKHIEFKDNPNQKAFIGSYNHQGPEDRKEYYC